MTRRTLYAVVAVVGLIVAVQLLWPSQRARPFLVVSDIPVGAATEQQVAQKLNTLKQSARLNLVLGEKTYNELLIDVGVGVNSEQTAKAAVAYPTWQRLIPLSLFGNLIHHPKVTTTVDVPNVEQRAREWSADAYRPATNATIAINGLEVQIAKDVAGEAYAPEKIQKALEKRISKEGLQTVGVDADTVKPVRTAKDIKATAKQAESAIQEPLTVQVLDKKIETTEAERASWLTFVESNDKKTLSLDIKKDQLQAFLAPYQKEVYIAPGTTVVTVVDGKETSKTEGAKGRGLDIDKTIAAIKAQLEKPTDKQVPLTITELKAAIKYNKTYSKTSAGLTAFLADLAKSKGDYAITVQELDGLGRSGSYNGSKLYHPASTYKLFVAYSVLKRIESGAMQWGTPYLNGQTVEQCFDAMIVRSDNACSEKFGKEIGWGTIQGELRAIGLSATLLVSGGGFRSNTNEQVQFLRKLNSGSLVSETSRTKLLSVMKRQIFRQGVPAGARTTVADKVGFLDGLLHDTAIVYSSHGTYLISIYTNGSSWANIADTTRKIDAFLTN